MSIRSDAMPHRIVARIVRRSDIDAEPLASPPCADRTMIRTTRGRHRDDGRFESTFVCCNRRADARSSAPDAYFAP
ncbi:hypothetical protein DB771_12300 [Burkholderia sp. AU29985]|nr:hypothetical protein XM57_21185 [Burkholderia cepacia]AYZ94479.1 hypothetical protein EGY28_05055 [Burkholderia dolosa]ETP63851.1 hypothetical protein BDSB_25020 [Burkholderia dolosa PC543]PRE52404.1 hypothetical protein C6P87_09205 [Burkholderia sp. AU12872]PUA76597.1 hypothetical protein DB771_12300 [Burkholderia sp. AU29985]